MNYIDLTHTNDIKPNLSIDFNAYLETKAQIQKLGYDPRHPCAIHFYEWSDLEQEKLFSDCIEFFNFLKQSQITTRYWEDNRIKNLGHSDTGVFIICKPGTKDIIIENSFNELQKSFERVKNYTTTTTTASTSPANTIPMVVSPHVGYGGYSAYGEDEYYGGFWE